MFFNNKAFEITVGEFKKVHSKICVYRAVGGLGDIIAMRMIFEDFKKKYPKFHITWAVPYKYFPVADQHPYVDELIHLEDFKKRNFIEVYDITTACGKYETMNAKGKLKNRSDIWAEHFGLNLDSHNLHMPSYLDRKEKVIQRLVELGWDRKKKLVAFAPRSAIGIKNMTFEQIKAVKDMTNKFFIFCLHHVPILEVEQVGIPAVYNFSLQECLCAIEISDFMISTDTGLMHAAAGYGKPTLATFSFVDGETYCKYYPNVQIVQLHYKNIDNWCGPCYDYSKCPYTSHVTTKPCQSEISAKMLQENWDKLLNRL